MTILLPSFEYGLKIFESVDLKNGILFWAIATSIPFNSDNVEFMNIVSLISGLSSGFSHPARSMKAIFAFGISSTLNWNNRCERDDVLFCVVDFCDRIVRTFVTKISNWLNEDNLVVFARFTLHSIFLPDVKS